jgi:hypothetical protein
METIITIKKNKPAYKALILLAKELEKNDNTFISIKEVVQKKKNFEIIAPLKNAGDAFSFFEQLSDFPTIDELREKAWLKVS